MTPRCYSIVYLAGLAALPSSLLTTTVPFSTNHVSVQSSFTNALLCEIVTTPPLNVLSACVSAASVSLSR
jgi:hypothetical protein